MKKILSLTALAVVLFSCSSDDGGDNVSSAVGTYNLTEFTISVPQDLNGDGVSSTNMFEETTCLDGAFIELHADNTFTASGEGIEISLDGQGNPQISCMDDGNYSGNWSISGNTITLTYTTDGDQYSDQFVVNGNTISLSVEDGQTVGSDSNGNPVLVTADINIEFTKQ